jgi:hypothetical protein
MSFVGVGMMEILLLLAGSSGLPANDLVSLIQAEDYFKARKIEVSAEKMVELAGKDPADGKTQIQQLLAIRWLGDNAEQTKKADGARALLERIAEGKKAQDPLGFAKGHARQALARLDGKPIPPLATMPDKSLRGDALKWFPTDLTMAGGYELRAGSKSSDRIISEVRKLLAKAIPEEERGQIFNFIDAIGNVRLDRAVAGIKIDDRGESERVVVRFSGAADAGRILDYVVSMSPEKIKPETKKGPGGEEVRYIAKDDMCFAFIGTNELFFLGDHKDKKAAEMIDEVLAIKAGKKKGLLEGPLTDLLRQAPDNARALFTGELPEGFRKEMIGKGSPLRAAPKSFLFHGTGDDKLTLTLGCTLKDKDEAEAFAESMLGLKQMALKGLDNVPAEVQIPPEMVKRLKQTLQGAKVSAEGSSVTGKVTVDSAEVLGDVLKLLLFRAEKRPALPEKPKE